MLQKLYHLLRQGPSLIWSSKKAEKMLKVNLVWIVSVVIVETWWFQCTLCGLLGQWPDPGTRLHNISSANMAETWFWHFVHYVHYALPSVKVCLKQRAMAAFEINLSAANLWPNMKYVLVMPSCGNLWNRGKKFWQKPKMLRTLCNGSWCQLFFFRQQMSPF